MRRLSLGARLCGLVLLGAPGFARASLKGEFGIRGLVSPFEADPLARELGRMARELVADNPGSFSNPQFSDPDSGRVAGGVGFNMDLVWKSRAAWKNALKAGLDLRVLNPKTVKCVIRDDYSWYFVERGISLETHMTQVMGTLGFTRRFGECQLSLVLGGGMAAVRSELFDADWAFYSFWWGDHSLNTNSGLSYLAGLELNQHLGGAVLVSLALEAQGVDFPDFRYANFEPALHLRDLGAAGRLGLTFAPNWEAPRANKVAAPEAEEEEETAPAAEPEQDQEQGSEAP